MSRAAMQQALEALELGHDSAQAEADQYHTAMAGYRPERHAQMDADVQQIANAITALRVALAEPEQEPVCDKDPGGCWNVRCQLGKVCKNTAPTPHKPLTPREIELLDGMIEVQLHHAAQCDRIANRTMAEKQKGWDMERVALLRKLKAAHGIGEQHGS